MLRNASSVKYAPEYKVCMGVKVYNKISFIKSFYLEIRVGYTDYNRLNSKK